MAYFNKDGECIIDYGIKVFRKLVIPTLIERIRRYNHDAALIDEPMVKLEPEFNNITKLQKSLTHFCVNYTLASKFRVSNPL